MHEVEAGKGVFHIPFVDVPDKDRVNGLTDKCQVVIPARDVAKTIGPTVKYLAEMGISPSRVHVIVNNCTDKGATLMAANAAQESGLCTVHDQEQIFATNPAEIELLRSMYMVGGLQLCGKGTAMFASMFVLEKLGLSKDAPVVFLDADIVNLKDVDPVGLLLFGWRTHGNPMIVKLASLNRDNAGILAFLGIPGNDYGPLGSLMWPLCGQVVVPWGVLRNLRLASHYAVEMAMLMQILDLAEQKLDRFVEVEIGTPLIDERNDDRTHTIMYEKIMAFMLTFIRRGDTLSGLKSWQIGQMNQVDRTHHFWVPRASGTGQNVFENHRQDAVLPSLAELRDK